MSTKLKCTYVPLAKTNQNKAFDKVFYCYSLVPISGFTQKAKIVVSTFIFVSFFLSAVKAQVASSIDKSPINYALSLDGADNNPCIGMGMMTGPWTIEAWIKGNDLKWKKHEAIIGVGEYGDVDGLDVMPLQLLDGKLHCPQANLTAKEALDDKWHYVALSNDGKETELYLDGKLIGAKKGRMTVLPGAIGAFDKPENTLGGLIDEVRIWDTAITQKVLNKWSNKPLTPKHPDFKKLKGYYNFDALVDDVCLNLVGKGHQAFHMRNTRLEYKGKLPLAQLKINDNKHFVNTIEKQEVFNAVAIETEWDSGQGAKGDELLKLRVVVNGINKPLKLTGLNLDFSETTNLSDIEKVHIYYAGQSPRDKTRIELFGSGSKAVKNLVLKTSTAYVLKPGVNYFLVTVDIKKNAVLGDTIRGKVSGFNLSGKRYLAEDQTANIRKTVIPAAGSTNITRLLQWNIWHGGIHMGNNGRNRVKELLRGSAADIICMQEAYGAQQMLADSLKFNMITPSEGANLALYSRYPIEKLSTKKDFNSNPAIITMPNQNKILIANWWLRYAYRPEYSDYYLNNGMDVRDWVKEDAESGAVDAKLNMDNDIDPIIKSRGITQTIISGDFNSGSHLDWTARAAPLHNGYGPVPFPISKLMMDRGYTDSFRKLNPNEVTHPAGTFAAIFGHLQTSRIDYIYYKGNGVKPIASKIIRTAPEIDDVWPSDHAAVLTVFEILK